jgi:imidazolonepropionase-like amidohydrolase
MSSQKTLVIRNGTLIDGSGKAAVRNEAIVIEGNRIRSVGPLPPDIAIEDRRHVDVIDAGGQWIMPGLIDAHCHVSYGYPLIKGEGKGKGSTRPEFSTLKSARSVQKVLRSGVTSISVPGGTWFTDVGIRDAIKLGLMAGPRMYVAGRMVVTYGCIEDDEPSWEGTPDHSVGKLCNTADEMVTEVRRQGKHGVNFIKMADSRSGESQMLAREEIAAVVGEAHRRNLRVGIHSRGAGSTRAAAEAGVDWIIHADLATDRDLEAVAKAGMPIIPTATFLAMVVELGQKVGAEQVQLDINRMKRHFDLLCELMHKARKLGIKLLVGTDTGNNAFTPHGELHAKELEIFVKQEAMPRWRRSSPLPATTPTRSASRANWGSSRPASLPTSSCCARTRSRTSPCSRAANTFLGNQGRQGHRPRAARRDAHVPAGGGMTACAAKRSTLRGHTEN